MTRHQLRRRVPGHAVPRPRGHARDGLLVTGDEPLAFPPITPACRHRCDGALHAACWPASSWAARYAKSASTIGQWQFAAIAAPTAPIRPASPSAWCWRPIEIPGTSNAMLIAQIQRPAHPHAGPKAYRVVETDRYLPPAVAALQPPGAGAGPGHRQRRPDSTSGARRNHAHLKQMLDALRAPTIILPGNHDDRVQLAATFADHPHCAGRRVRGFTPSRTSRCASSCSTRWCLSAKLHGALYERRLQWLAQRLAEQPGRPTVIVMIIRRFAQASPHGCHRPAGRRARAGGLVARHSNVERIIMRPFAPHHFPGVFGGTIASTCPSPARRVVAGSAGPDGISSRVRHGTARLSPHEWRDGALVTHHAYIESYPRRIRSTRAGN